MSEAIDLQGDTDAVISRFLSDIEKTLESHKVMRIDQTFKVCVTVIGNKLLETIRSRPSTRQTTKQSKMIHGCLKSLLFQPKGTVSILEGIPTSRVQEIQTYFSGLCLPVSIIIAACVLLAKLQRDGYDERGAQMKRLFSKIKGEKVQGMKAAKKEFDRLLKAKKVCHDANEQYLEEVCPNLSEEYSVNILIHSNHGYDEIFHRTPKIFKESWPSIHLLSTITNNNTAHISIIDRLPTYSQWNGTACIFCGKSDKSRSFIHTCSAQFSNRSKCKKCKRIFATEETFLYFGTKNIFCDSEINRSEPLFCFECKFMFYSTDCFHKHRSTQCHRSRFCEICHKVYKHNKQKPHNCLSKEKYCR